MEDPSNRYIVLIKFMDIKYVDSFLNDGLLYLNNIRWFINHEDVNIAIRGDRHEGLAASFKAENMIFEINGRILKDTFGKIDLRYIHENETNIYSMTKEIGRAHV